MLRPCLKKIEIQGFRSFGKEPQAAVIDAPIAAFWGPNSKGKTSFAEAVEFLLTGQTVKRELLASRRDEFAGALRHAHLPADVPTYVLAALECADGSSHIVKRTLYADYTKQGDCQTTLTIDGNPATEADLLALGIMLSQAPLRAPVLAQHTLNYLFTVSPSDRSTYFKALLEVTDLDEFRNDIAALQTATSLPDDPLVAKLELVNAIPDAMLIFLGKDLTDSNELQDAFSELATALLTAESIEVPATLEEQVEALAELLEKNRAKQFPLHLFDQGQSPTFFAPTDADWDALETYLSEREAVDEETRQLTGLFKDVLSIPAYGEASHPQDCPVCETPDALTPARIAAIRTSVQSTETFAKASDDAITALRRMQTNLSVLRQTLTNALPRFSTCGGATRREAGFTVERMEALLEGESANLVPPWMRELRRLLRAHRAFIQVSADLVEALRTASSKLHEVADCTQLKELTTAVAEAEKAFEEANSGYRDVAAPLRDALKQIVDSKSATAGWQYLIDLSADLPSLREAVVEQAVHNQIKEELTAALKQIDKGIDEVLDKKFAILSKAVAGWWDLLRGGEPTFFSGVKRRGKITIDFKGGLSPHHDQSNPKFRDVIAVFSDSQLHCLGLAIFLARAEHYGSTFLVLDDPVLTSDEDYRVHFRSRVIQKLHQLGVQTIILTQHRATQRDIATINEHLGVEQFQLDIPDPGQGSRISKTSDEFGAMLASAVAYTNSDDPQIRKDGGRKLRDAAERFCKMLLVRKRKEGGDEHAAISDYEGRMLGGNGGLVQAVLPYMTADPADPGKLKTIPSDLNPPSHDDDGIPSKQALRQTLGNLQAFRSVYLI